MPSIMKCLLYIAKPSMTMTVVDGCCYFFHQFALTKSSLYKILANFCIISKGVKFGILSPFSALQIPEYQISNTAMARKRNKKSTPSLMEPHLA